MQNETTFTLNRADEDLALDHHTDSNQHGLTITTFLEEQLIDAPAFEVLQQHSSSTATETFHDHPIGSVPAHTEQSRILELEEQVRMLLERNAVLEDRGKKLAQELDIFRQRRLVYWSDRFRNKFDAWHLMHPSFEEIKDDTMLFQGNLKGFRLLPSLNLVRLSSLKYELDLGRQGLCAILLAPIIDLPSMVGEICVRITDCKQIVLQEVSVPIAEISEEQPCELRFPSLEENSLNRLIVHIFAQGVDLPVRIFELRKYPKLGFARLERKLFAGYRFRD